MGRGGYRSLSLRGAFCSVRFDVRSGRLCSAVLKLFSIRQHILLVRSLGPCRATAQHAHSSLLHIHATTWQQWPGGIIVVCPRWKVALVSCSDREIISSHSKQSQESNGYHHISSVTRRLATAVKEPLNPLQYGVSVGLGK